MRTHLSLLSAGFSRIWQCFNQSRLKAELIRLHPLLLLTLLVVLLATHLCSCRSKQEATRTEQTAESYTQEQLLSTLLTSLHIDDLEITWEPVPSYNPTVLVSLPSASGFVEGETQRTIPGKKNSHPRGAVPESGSVASDKPPTDRLTLRAHGFDANTAQSVAADSETDSASCQETEKTINTTPLGSRIPAIACACAVVLLVLLLYKKHPKN